MTKTKSLTGRFAGMIAVGLLCTSPPLLGCGEKAETPQQPPQQTPQQTLPAPLLGGGGGSSGTECWWSGASPFCSGSCSPWYLRGNAANYTRAYQLLNSQPDIHGELYDRLLKNFGVGCVFGSKALCCTTPGYG
jgi:hypothetical protein